MNNTRNALAELAKELNYVDAYEPPLWIGHRKAVCKAQRIIAELATVQVADGMARRVAARANCLEYSFGNEPLKTVGIFTTQHFPKWICSALNAVENCRAIAGENPA